jgi:hypothetical protein
MFAALLTLFAILSALEGFFTLTQVTQGVGFIAIACFLGILARLAQAEAYQKKVKELLTALITITLKDKEKPK